MNVKRVAWESRPVEHRTIPADQRSPGGNITSDNIGPQHLMNVKRVAWESRPVEHRTIPADQRLVAMSVPMHKSAAAVGAALRAARVSPSEIAPPASTSESSQSFAPPVQRRDSAAAPSFAPPAKGGDFDSGVRQGTAFHPEERRPPLSSERAAVPKSDSEKGALAPEASRPRSTLSPIVAAAAALAPVPDRQTIARIVEQVFTARGIPRRSGSSFAPPAKGGDFASVLRQGTALAVPKPDAEKGALAPEAIPLKFAPTPSPAPHPFPPPLEVAEFLSENDVRMALTRDRKLYIGPKTILTPSARDLGNEHEIFVMTDIVPATKKRRSE